MEAVRLFGPGDLRVLHVPCPALVADGTVRVRVVAAGICGSDLHNFRAGRWISHLPVTPGHECAGIVTETRGDCGALRPGQAVVADSRIGCGACPACRAGMPNRCPTLGFVGEACDGGFAEEIVLPARQFLPLPPGLPLHLGALAEPLSVALHAVRQLAPARGAPVVVCGGGTIGGLAALVLHRRGHAVHLLERNAARQALLAAHTGTDVLPPEAAAWNARFGAEGPRFILDATGAASVVDMALARIASGGTLALAGIFHESPKVDLNIVVEREITLRGVGAFSDEMTDAIARLPELADALESLVTMGHKLAETPRLYDRLLSGDAPRLKTLIAPNGIGSEW